MLTVEDLVEKLQLSRQTLYRLRKKGILPPPIKVGSSLRWRVEDIDAWLSWLQRRADDEAAGLDPNRIDGPSPPVPSTGESLFDPRAAAAANAEAARRQRSQEIRRCEDFDLEKFHAPR